ncbi:uncharacterized protein LOC123507200 isoform X1 [Portunus trituberculatus]|uniref:uncharacterized protein LOC123507200 isoform X1 n=1 Tax=Portunus trituberculatus TaxID=210409 RepID=UPI001E1CE9BA|nr:uncharacterized protein LOC123507200 isoform X1 [Portunus trituberculatus]
MIRDSRRFSLGLELWKNTTALAAFTTSCLSTSLSSASLLPTIHSSPCKRFSLGNGLCEEYYRTGCLHDKLLLVRVPLLPLCCPTSHFSRYKSNLVREFESRFSLGIWLWKNTTTLAAFSSCFSPDHPFQDLVKYDESSTPVWEGSTTAYIQA